jgi:RNA polymerase sigma factor (sigma-70 family)
MAGPRPYAPLPRLSPDRRALVDKNQKLATWTVNRFYSHLRGDRRQEAVSAAYEALVIAASKFDPARGSFSTFAVEWARQRIQRYFEKERRRGFRGVPADGPGLVASLYAPTGEEAARLADFVVADPGPNPDAAPDVAELLAGLPGRERVTLEALYLFEIPARDLARGWGISVARVDQLRRRALKRLRERAGSETDSRLDRATRTAMSTSTTSSSTSTFRD